LRGSARTGCAGPRGATTRKRGGGNHSCRSHYVLHCVGPPSGSGSVRTNIHDGCDMASDYSLGPEDSSSRRSTSISLTASASGSFGSPESMASNSPMSSKTIRS